MALMDTSTPPAIQPAHTPIPDLSLVPAVRSHDTAFEFDIAVVGLGYVGLPTALAHHHAGARVLGLDVSPSRLSAIAQGDVDLIDSDHVRLRAALVDDALELTSDASRLSQAETVIVCVPTPVDRYLVPDLTLLQKACDMVVEHAVAGQLLMLTSTTYVGCTEDLLLGPVTRKGLVAGQDIYISFSAERIDPGSEQVVQEAVPRVVGGATPACLERATAALGGYATSVHQVSSLGTAEMTKLLENTFRAVNIALANEFADICRGLGLDVAQVIDAAATKPYGYMPFLPGPGVGGHCIPCDPHYLLWQLKKSRVEAPVIAEAMQQIASRPTRVVDRIRQLVSERGTSLIGARILVMGIAYKPNVADLRESPALEILQRLHDLGAAVGYVDPHIPSAVLEGGMQLEPVEDPVSFRPTLVLLHTPHRAMDLQWMPDDQLVLDATYRSASMKNMVAL